MVNQFKINDIVSSKNGRIKNARVYMIDNDKLYLKKERGRDTICYAKNFIIIKRYNYIWSCLKYAVFPKTYYFFNRIIYKYNPLNYRIIHKDNITNY